MDAQVVELHMREYEPEAASGGHPMSGARLLIWISIGLGLAIAAATSGLLVAVLIMSSPIHRGERRSVSHSAVDRMDRTVRSAHSSEATREQEQ
jgi:hypothetical protein